MPVLHVRIYVFVYCSYITCFMRLLHACTDTLPLCVCQRSATLDSTGTQYTVVLS